MDELLKISYGENTKKALANIPANGLLSGKKRLSRANVVARIGIFQMQKDGITMIPSGNADKFFVRQAVIKDTIDETKKLKMQASLRYLKSVASTNKGGLVTLHYDPLTGQITDYELSGIDAVLSSVGVMTQSAREKEWARGVNERNMEVAFASDGQISSVTFETQDPKEEAEILSSGLIKEQIMVMAAVAEHNKKTWNGKTPVYQPYPEVKRDFVRLGKLAGSTNFWDVFNQKQ